MTAEVSIRSQSTVFGVSFQPHSVGCFPYRSRMDRQPDTRLVLWANVRALMKHQWGKENLTRLAAASGVGPGTVSRMKACETYLQLDTIAAIAGVFELAVWQILVPGLEPSNPPVLAAASPSERRMYKRFLAFRKAMESGDDDDHDEFEDTRPGAND